MRWVVSLIIVVYVLFSSALSPRLLINSLPGHHALDAGQEKILNLPTTVKASARVGCFSLQKKNTIVCIFNDQRVMNAALSRALEFIENKIMLSDHEFLNSTERGVHSEVLGHDLRARDLNRFYKKFRTGDYRRISTPSQSQRIWLQIEEDFWENFLLPTLSTSDELIVIAAFEGAELARTLSHELLHVRFFSDGSYRESVKKFFEQNVTAHDQHEIAKILNDFYELSLEREGVEYQLLLNEFQAYILMDDPFQDLLGDFVARYRSALSAFLKQR